MSWFLLGAAAWSASEYAIHRFIGHGPKRATPRSIVDRLTPSGLAAEFNREHLAHHTDPTYFAPAGRKLLAAGAVLPVFMGALTPVVGVRRAAAFSVGFGVAYGAYEVMHRRIHTRAPRGRYGRWVRRHHLHHHYKSPRGNHGVTSPLWDWAFTTLRPLERIRVPRKTAPSWLVGADGAVTPELAADYDLAEASPRRAVSRPLAER